MFNNRIILTFLCNTNQRAGVLYVSADKLVLGMSDSSHFSQTGPGSLELRSLPDLSLLSRRILGPVPVSAVYVDERGIVSGDDAGQVVCWDADAQMPGEEWQIKWRGQHQGRIVALNRGGGDSIISAGLDGHIMARKAETGEHMFSIPNHKVWLGSMCVSEELDLLVTDGRDNAVYLYDFGNP